MLDAVDLTTAIVTLPLFATQVNMRLDVVCLVVSKAVLGAMTSLRRLSHASDWIDSMEPNSNLTELRAGFCRSADLKSQ